MKERVFFKKYEMKQGNIFSELQRINLPSYKTQA